MKKFLAVLFVIIGWFALNAAVWGGLVWLACWALPLIGITAIGTWTIAFSWKLVLIVAVVVTILKAIFSTTVTVRR